MTHQPAPTPATTTDPPDLDTMRATIQRALTGNPQPGDLALLRLTLEGHLHAILPPVETLATRLPDTAPARACALACAGAARLRLRPAHGGTIAVQLAGVHRLARSLQALCDHYDKLGA